MTDFPRLLAALVEASVDSSLDLLGEAAGGGTYEALSTHTETRTVFGLPVRFVDLETLLRLKRAAGRPKDLERIAELEAIRAQRRS